MAKTTAERFWAKVAKGEPDECWPWTAALVRGYGWFYDGSRGVVAHRWLFELVNGPVPDGLDLDHTCHNGTGCVGGDLCLHRRCVNPLHLEPVPRRVNLARGNRSTYWADQTHCIRGHEFTEANTYRSKSGRRQCRACQAMRMREATGRKPWVEKWAETTHCPNGHEWTAENTRWKPEGGRSCRTCARDATRRYRERKRAQAA